MTGESKGLLVTPIWSCQRAVIVCSVWSGLVGLGRLLISRACDDEEHKQSEACRWEIDLGVGWEVKLSFP